ncbi:MAG: phosphoenolpyruvate carboxykinase (ATP), partial [Actinomycetota bacterium]
NVFQDDAGSLDFFCTTYTHNGRASFSLKDVTAYDPSKMGKADLLLILNRNENVIPAVAKLPGPLAAAYFMLGETQGTSAGGADEEGRALRVPGTNPFFPLDHGLQGNRLLELLETHPLPVYLLNTGRIGGPETEPESRKVRIADTSAILRALAEDEIKWEADPDFGYLVASEVPGLDADAREILQPGTWYEARGRTPEYREFIARLKADRAEFLGGFPSLDPGIAAALS